MDPDDAAKLEALNRAQLRYEIASDYYRQPDDNWLSDYALNALYEAEDGLPEALWTIDGDGELQCSNDQLNIKSLAASIRKGSRAVAGDAERHRRLVHRAEAAVGLANAMIALHSTPSRARLADIKRAEIELGQARSAELST